jgi:hypothetical protein
MRRHASAALIAMLALPALALAAPDPDDVQRARQARARAVGRVRALTAEADRLTGRYRALGARADRAAASLIDAYRAELELEGQLAGARQLLSRRANAAYRAGPGAMLAVLLDSVSPGDFLASEELLERTIYADIRRASDVLERSEEASRLRLDVERRRAAVLASYRKLNELRDLIDRQLELAAATARRAGLRFAAVRAARQRFLKEQAALAKAIGGSGVDQSDLLALLGPNKGRGCDIPPKLRLTDRTISGTASWYGWEFAGRPTATGAMFDPRLFTAAHKSLPLNSFLRVRWNGGCAIVLMNDRGPYHGDWVFDLAQAPARYLGYERAGTAEVEADILVRR